MSDQAVLLPKWSPNGIIILAKYQPGHSYTFWAKTILIFSPVYLFLRHPLFTSFFEESEDLSLGLSEDLRIHLAQICRYFSMESDQLMYLLIFYRKFPPFLKGPSFIISGDLIPRMLMATTVIPVLPLSQVFFTGLVPLLGHMMRIGNPNKKMFFPTTR